MIRIFIGVDQRQKVAFHVAAQSIIDHASVPVSITPLVLKTLPITRRGLSDFTYSRFLVPYLCEYSGQAIFMDGDVLVRGDVAELSSKDAVSVVFHAERSYENASVMVFDCAQCRVLTPEYVETAKNPLKLDWAASVGQLPKSWNHLVGYDVRRHDAKLVHFTQGIPCFDETRNDEHAEEWNKTAAQCMSTVDWETIMGNSVHAKHKRAA